MKYYLIAGEASGDLHASNLMQGIKLRDAQADFRFFGGDLMQRQGGTLVKHYRDMAFMGFLEVLLHIGAVLKNAKLCKKDLIEYQPDVLILVDYSGFNLRVAKFAKRAGLKVFYYIAPKVWAWNTKRVKKIRKHVDKLFIIFPFEHEFFSQHGVDAVYEGNPSADAIAAKMAGAPHFDRFAAQNGLTDKPIVALVPGSRKQEVKYNLPVMLTQVARFPQYQFVIAGAPAISQAFYQKFIAGFNVKLVFDQTYTLLNVSTLAFVTSGTATLEAALLNVPQVVCYRGNLITMLIALMVKKVKYVSLVNLNMRRETVKELLQYDLTPDNLYNEAQKLLPGRNERSRMLADYAELRKLLGEPGASERVGARIVLELNKV